MHRNRHREERSDEAIHLSACTEQQKDGGSRDFENAFLGV